MRTRTPPAANETDLSLRPDIRVCADTSPTFLLQAEDDHVDGVSQSLAYDVALALQKAGVPKEMHLYAQGGHAFGLRATKLPHRPLARAGGAVAAHHRCAQPSGRRLTLRAVAERNLVSETGRIEHFGQDLLKELRLNEPRHTMVADA